MADINKISKRKICLLCNKTFASSSSLSTHKKRCTIDNNPEKLLIKEKEDHNKREFELLDKIRILEKRLDTPNKILSLKSNSKLPQSYPKVTPKLPQIAKM